MPDPTRLCVQCNAQPLTGRQKLYCSPSCSSRAFNRARIADGRLTAQRRAQHATRIAYQRSYQRVVWRAEVTCVACGTAMTQKRDDAGRYEPTCSDTCRGAMRRATWPSSQVPARHPSRSTPVPADHPSRRSTCPRCMRTYSRTYPDQIYCTALCTRRASDSRREARERGAWTEDVSPARVYARDCWRCHLCGKQLDRQAVVPAPRAPTLDHVIPLSKGGTHSLANVRAAHFACNIRKGNRGGGEQLALLG